MNPVKTLHATRIGLRNLQEQILPLRAKLRKLENAHTKLSNMRYEADLQLAHVKVIPPGMTKKKAEEEEKRLLKAIADMSDEMREELFSKLEEMRGG